MNTWTTDLNPLLKKYGSLKHPLNYNNRYQLLVMVILAAQASDNQINRIAPEFFKAFPSIEALKNRTPEDLYSFTKSVRGFRKKSAWIIKIAQTVEEDSKIPETLEGLTKLPGIGRKTANIIIRESGGTAEGIMVDLHVARVAPRLGIVVGANPDKIEKSLMDVFARESWNEVGMALSYHGREICRPKPKCLDCIVNQVCNYYQTIIAEKNKGLKSEDVS